MEAKQNNILHQYEALEPQYRALATTAADLIARILSAAGIQVHSITGRAKSRESLAGKIARPDKGYRSLSDLTDLAGVRITTYFSHDVDRVASLIEAEFAIDRENSFDKRRLHDPDRFGYMSLHYVATLSATRCSLAEYRRFGGLKFEVQVRSILQHAWAEMEHDLGYKTKLEVPKDIRRRFARLAGLLELADDEFSGMRDALAAYEKDVVQQIRHDADDVEINKISLVEFMNSDPDMLRLDDAVAQAARKTLGSAEDSLVERYVLRSAYLQVSSIGELQRRVRDYFALTRAFAQIWFANIQSGHLRRGIGLFYLGYVLVAERRERTLVEEYVRQMNIGEEEERAMLIDRILTTYEQALLTIHQSVPVATAQQGAAPGGPPGLAPLGSRPRG